MSHPSPSVTYSPRQIDVLYELVEDGADNETIGKRLGLRLDTIKTHVRVIFGKAQINNRTALAVGILRGHIVVLDDEGQRVHFR